VTPGAVSWLQTHSRRDAWAAGVLISADAAATSGYGAEQRLEMSAPTAAVGE
jgi:hypothetical protein